MTTPTQTLDLLLVSPLAGLPTGDDVWLRMEQILGDDLVTHGEIAQVVDELYQVDPCLPEVEAEAARDTFNTLPAGASVNELLELAARRFNLAECSRRKNGDYVAKVKIIRSHLLPEVENRYTLVPSVGQVTGISPTTERITLTLAVKEQDYLVLDYPVRHEGDQEWPGTVEWLGSVWTEKRGAISPPLVTGRGRVLSWSLPCTGTLLIRVDTAYDIATIAVPGLPGAAPGSADAVQECTLRAFYRFQVYEAEIAAAITDPSANQDDLAKICGWSDITGGGLGSGSGGLSEDGDGDDDDDGDDADDGPELGCLSPAENLADPEFYRQVCCEPPPFGLPNCAVHASDRGRAQLSPAEQARQAEGHRGKTTFVAVGPGPNGCGRLLRRQQVNRRNCCADVTPMSPDPENPSSMAPGTSEIFAVLGGRDWNESGEWWQWRTSGGLTLPGGGTSAEGGRSMTVNAPAEWCASGSVRVDDGCTVLTMRVDNREPPEPLAVVGIDHVVSPGGYISIAASGGTLPYRWAGSAGLQLISDEMANPATFLASDDFCGSATVRVSDACATVAEGAVRSTAGFWVEIFDFDKCNPPGAGKYPDYGASYVSSWNNYYVVVSRNWQNWIDGQCSGGEGICPPGTAITSIFDSWARSQCASWEQYYGDCLPVQYSNGCCLIDGRPWNMCDQPPMYSHHLYYEAALRLFEWRCTLDE